MKKLSALQLRQMWLDFFCAKGASIFPSAPLVPINDDSLLWVNAGVTPLKKYFDGSEMPPAKRLVSIQKCIRTNDIENVGNTSRHHTFFEMLGNFSIGDYFKKEVIPWAYELLTSQKWFSFDKEKLYITYYPDDKETFNLWLALGIPESHLIASEDNFWEIGAGPSGPCTEIYYDRGTKYDKRGPELIAKDINNDRYIEIWNIVFSAFNADPKLKRTQYKELPNKNIDTGAGLERLLSIFQDTPTNFETDLFMPLINQIGNLTNKQYSGQSAFKIIADHIKTITMALYDGAVFAAEGRGYVLRRLLRRAARAGRSLGVEEAFLFKLVASAYQILAPFYQLAPSQQEIITKQVKAEEEKFLKTLLLGEKKIKELIKNKKTITSEDAFLLADTYGFPLELTMEYAQEYHLNIDTKEYNNYLLARQNNSREAIKNKAMMHSQNEAYLKFNEPSIFCYDKTELNATIIKVFPEGIVLDKTCLYATSGGQESDHGFINDYIINEIIKLPNGQHLHLLTNHNLKEGDSVSVKVALANRLLTCKNHSATHLLQKTLQTKLNANIKQHGSKVCANYLRFDFNYEQKITDAQLLLLENAINEQIKAALPVDTLVLPQKEATKLGAMQLFGEKYGALVRVVKMGDYSLEFCGGTHVHNSSEIEGFAFTKLESVGSGLWRLEAITGDVKSLMQATLHDLKEKIKTLANGLIKLTFPPLKGSYLDIINYREYYQAIKKKVYAAKEAANNELATSYKNNLAASIKSSKVLIETAYDLKIIKNTIDELFNEHHLSLLVLINPQTMACMIKATNGLVKDLAIKAKQAKLILGGGNDNFMQGKINNLTAFKKFLVPYLK